jgi:hypothetical protein
VTLEDRAGRVWFDETRALGPPLAAPQSSAHFQVHEVAAGGLSTAQGGGRQLADEAAVRGGGELKPRRTRVDGRARRLRDGEGAGV